MFKQPQLQLPEIETVYELKILWDSDPLRPRGGGSLGTLCAWHRRYNLGDEGAIEKAIEDAYYLLTEEEREQVEEGYIDLDDPSTLYRILQEKGAMILPVYMFEHSGISLSTAPYSCPWDSGQLGFIYMTQEEIEDVFGNTHPETIEKVEGYLKASISDLSAWVEGDVYGFELYVNGELTDSCWGFYGQDWENNGLKDHLPDEVHHLLEDIEVDYGQGN